MSDLRKPKLGFHKCKLSFLWSKLGNVWWKFAQVARQSALTDAAIFILSKNDKLKLLTAVRYVWWHKKGVTAHRAAPLADSPTSCPKSTESKNTATVESQNTNLIARANSSSPKRALETVVPGDGSPFKATAVSSVDGAKVQQNSEITKLSSKKELPPVLPLRTNRGGISQGSSWCCTPV
jgi:hypothetical protein